MNGKQHITDIIFMLSLFCVFAVLALFVVVLGADVYKGISADMDQNDRARTSVAYLTEKMRQNDVPGGVAVDRMGGGDALVLKKNVGGKRYETWIFAADGSLRELTVAEGTQPTAEAGQEILDAASLKVIREEGNLFKITVEDSSGNEFEGAVALKSAGDME